MDRGPATWRKALGDRYSPSMFKPVPVESLSTGFRMDRLGDRPVIWVEIPTLVHVDKFKWMLNRVSGSIPPDGRAI